MPSKESRISFERVYPRNRHESMLRARHEAEARIYHDKRRDYRHRKQDSPDIINEDIRPSLFEQPILFSKPEYQLREYPRPPYPMPQPSDYPIPQHPIQQHMPSEYPIPQHTIPDYPIPQHPIPQHTTHEQPTLHYTQSQHTLPPYPPPIRHNPPPYCPEKDLSHQYVDSENFQGYTHPYIYHYNYPPRHLVQVEDPRRPLRMVPKIPIYNDFENIVTNISPFLPKRSVPDSPAVIPNLFQNRFEFPLPVLGPTNIPKGEPSKGILLDTADSLSDDTSNQPVAQRKEKESSSFVDMCNVK